MSRSPSVEVVAEGLAFPECPRWHDGELWFTDGSTVKRRAADGALITHATFDAPLVIGLALLPEGAMLAGTAWERRVYFVDADGRATLHADLSGHFQHPTNEILATPDGGLVAGSIGFDPNAGTSPSPVPLAHVAADGTISSTGAPLMLANGMKFTPDGARLIVAEMAARRITVQDVGADLTLEGARTFADLAPLGDEPDGIELCPDGTVWYASFRGAAVVRVADGGAELERVELPCAHPTACVLSNDGRSLFVTGTQVLPWTDGPVDGAGMLLRVGLYSD
jgi:sugar lactone lactonase YvrE